MSEQQTAYDKIREQKEIRQLGTGDLPKQGSHVSLKRLKNVSAWKPVTFTHEGEEWLVECKRADMIDSIVTMSDMTATPEVEHYINTRNKINADPNIDDDEKKQMEGQAWQNLTDQQRAEAVRYEKNKANAILIGAIRFPQEVPDTYLYLGFEDADDTVSIKSLDTEFIECLHIVYQDVNWTEEVTEAINTFREVGETEQGESD